ncbi:YicC/YloC family endoribonuclease [Metabacillus litoralis]|uniref:YicC/YloC family endoribonuclease n=1 Tax=Metabacillus litoralis TaxID=152268 RepID=UPI001CFDB7E1|nr:YicC/YloC family endoribonuclease [Metabacillus litoralis]
MVVSMTGFGRASKQINSCFFTVEMKSVNHRFLDVNLKMPKQFLGIEDKIRKIISHSISRGRLEVYINFEGELISNKTLKVDWQIIDQFVASLKKIKENHSIYDQISLDHILSFREGIEVVEESISSDEFEDELIQLVEAAVKQLVDMRVVEGEQLKNDLTTRLKKLQEITFELEKIAPTVVENYRERIRKRVEEFVLGKLDENRILTEVALFADKADINEELTRIHSHIHQFIETLKEHEPIGRKLDFLVQELNREANTIGSKANDGLIAKNVVELKSIIEKLKEQVQNIE